MTASRLGLYNGALAILGERKLASLTENREPRRVLDDIWDEGAVGYCLEQGLWNFAMRSVELSADPDVSPQFGYRNAFSKPSDYVRTAAVASDEYFNSPLTQYSDEAGYWWADIDPLYVKFVSNGASYGADFAKWPGTFTLFVEHYLAHRACTRLTQSKTDKEQIKKDMKKALTDARSKDAMNEPASFLPSGSWSAARRGGSGGDRTGPRLIG